VDRKAARLVGVGVFVISGMLLFAIGLFMIGDRQMAFSRRFTIYTEFARVSGLQPGAIVRVSGAKAGEVKDIEVPASPAKKFRVRMEVTEDLHPLIRTDSVAAIQTEGLVGGTFLAIATGSEQAPKAPRDSTLPSQEPFDLADLLQQMSETVRRVNTTIDEMKDDVQHAVQSIYETVDNANSLITDVSDDVKTMASAGARISGDIAEIANNIRSGRGTIGRLVNDDELYRKMNSVARSAEDISSNVREATARAREAIDNLQAKNGPVQGVTADLRQTLGDARDAMAGLAENMEALKHNFLFRGYFKSRGYFSLSQISPAEYRKGAMTANGERQPVRVWLAAPVLFEIDPETDRERLSEAGKARLDSAIEPFLDRVSDVVLMLEGYSQVSTHDARYLQSLDRASSVREYLIGRFRLDAQSVGAIALENESPGSPNHEPWNGVALAFFMAKD
jgi:phospholipid/cholesterol/gamma-HCH transport system substrate-binding protein